MTEFVINDQTAVDNPLLNGGMCGSLPRREPVGSLPFASTDPFDLVEWEAMPDMIADQERNKSSLYHLWKDSPMGALNQNPLLWCWAFSSVEAMMLERIAQGLKFVRLSPSSVAGPLVNYRNMGYYPEQALERMVTDGAASTAFVPETTNRKSDFKSGWEADASKYKVTKWRDVGNDAQRQNTMLLRNKPLVCTHQWWSHAILHMRLIDRNPRLPANNPQRYARTALQSWGPGEGENGAIIIEGNRSIADQSYSILQAKFTE